MSETPLIPRPIRDPDRPFLAYQDAGSDKFWAFIDCGDGDAVVFWGRQGRPPQQAQKVSLHEARARHAVKCREGYEPFGEAGGFGEMSRIYRSSPAWFDRPFRLAGGVIRAAMEAEELERVASEASKKSKSGPSRL